MSITTAVRTRTTTAVRTRTAAARGTRSAVRRGALALAATGALALAAPGVAHADTLPQTILTPNSTICLKVTAVNGLHAAGTATNQGATFSVFRNGIVVYLTTPNTVGFAADLTGSGTYKVCASNTNSTNTKVTLTATPL